MIYMRYHGGVSDHEPFLRRLPLKVRTVRLYKGCAEKCNGASKYHQCTCTTELAPSSSRMLCCSFLDSSFPGEPELMGGAIVQHYEPIKKPSWIARRLDQSTVK